MEQLQSSEGNPSEIIEITSDQRCLLEETL